VGIDRAYDSLMRHAWRTLTVVLVMLVAVSACGGNDERSSSGGGEGGASAALGAEAADVNQAAPPGAPADEREIVYTADVVVRVGDVEQASATATGIAEEAEGYLAGQDAQLEGDQESTLTIRVPSDRFRPVLDQLTDLGTVQQRQIGSTDVTEEVVDLSGRLESVRTSADRLRTLLAEAPGTEQVIAIEQELAERESQIESLEGRLRVLDDQTSLATITVRFTEKAEPPEVDEDLPGFVQALKAGGVAVVTALLVLLAAVGFLLPFLPFVALAWFGVRWYRRRHPKPEPTPLPRWTPPGAGGPPAAPPATHGPSPDPPTGGPDGRPAPPQSSGPSAAPGAPGAVGPPLAAKSSTTPGPTNPDDPPPAPIPGN